jgi:hypothetical protein
MAKWLSVLGLALTMFGILIAFYLPGIGFNLPRQGNFWVRATRLSDEIAGCDAEPS